MAKRRSKWMIVVVTDTIDSSWPEGGFDTKEQALKCAKEIANDVSDSEAPSVYVLEMKYIVKAELQVNIQEI